MDAEPSTGPSAKRHPLSGRVFSRGDTPASAGNIANIITVVRILLAPVFVALLFADDHEFGPLRYFAAALFVVTIVTDSLDGYLARGRNLITDLGIILDPIADKILIGSALVALSVLGDLPWWVTIVILVREFGITIFRFAVLSKGVIPASRGGKLKTVVQALAISLFLVAPWTFLGEWAGWVSWIVMGAAIALTVVTGVEYLYQAWKQNRAR